VSWLTFNPTSGTGYSTITVTAQANNGLARTATISVTSDEYASLKAEYIQTITVSQAGVSGSTKTKEIHNDVLFFPNPAKSCITIMTDAKMKVQIYSLAGELLVSKELLTSENVSVENLSVGVYEVKLISKDSVLTKQLIIQ
jgi:hypothetical protein